MADTTTFLVWGAAAIGREIDKSERQVYHLASVGALPVRRVGNQLVAARDDLHDLSRWPGQEQK